MRLKRELRLNMHAMKAIAIIVLLLLVVVNALELLPAASAFQMYLSGGSVALGLVALIAIWSGAARHGIPVVLALRRPDRCQLRLAQTRQTPRSSVFWRFCRQGAGWSIS